MPATRYNIRPIQTDHAVITDSSPADPRQADLKKGADVSRVGFREPRVADGADIWQLVDSTSLDNNSPYAYLLIAEHFAATSVVAEIDGQLAGFIAGYCPPNKPDTFFVWQVGVAPAGRGHGLATRMIADILGRDACRHVRYLDSTVSPSNEASKALFRGMARKFGTEVSETELFTEAMFPPGAGHEPEVLFRVGPFKPDNLDLTA